MICSSFEFSVSSFISFSFLSQSFTNISFIHQVIFSINSFKPPEIHSKTQASHSFFSILFILILEDFKIYSNYNDFIEKNQKIPHVFAGFYIVQINFFKLLLLPSFFLVVFVFVFWK